eukprot:TRINITY_DN43725_c0_g1_i1.p1 TRINITY_DN43725_c0_g1~~TRINITY_DN43725_c0_g1_i1.p1  ORF type:complete len:533 (-),score=146.65 TRINITY_DN43725_c0_g1_i1:261-1787(-)
MSAHLAGAAADAAAAAAANACSLQPKQTSRVQGLAQNVELAALFLFPALLACVLPSLASSCVRNVTAPALFLGMLAVLWLSQFAYKLQEQRICRLANERQKLGSELEESKKELAAATERASTAADRCSALATRLAAAEEELQAFGSEEERSRCLAAGDEIGIQAAELSFYAGQVSAARDAKISHDQKIVDLCATSIPAAQAEVDGLEDALKDAASETQCKELDRQSADSSVEKLRADVERLKKLHSDQKEELLRMEGEAQALRESSAEARKQIEAEAKRRLLEMDREVEMDERKLRWTESQRSTAERGNEALRAALAQKESECEELEAALEGKESERTKLEEESAALQKRVDELQASVREREWAEGEAARQRQRQQQEQRSLEDLRVARREAIAAKQAAEKKEQETQIEAAKLCQHAESVEQEAEQKRNKAVETLQRAVESHNRSIDELHATHHALMQAGTQINDLRMKFHAVEHDKLSLRSELKALHDRAQQRLERDNDEQDPPQEM